MQLGCHGRTGVMFRHGKHCMTVTLIIFSSKFLVSLQLTSCNCKIAQ